jgi:putative protease
MNAPQPHVELVAPAGNYEKLETAIHFGADAVYLSGKHFSLRNFADNFSSAELEAAVALAHSRGVKVYVACNIYSRNHEQQDLQAYLRRLAPLGLDGIIVADPAIFLAVQKHLPGTPIHISTQSNTTNYVAAQFWHDLGAERMIAARELSLPEITAIVSRGRIQVEVFVHGAMCISYSGRCLLSSFLTHRDSNRGRCAQPCRWKYAVVEEQRPGQYLPLREDARGSYLFNARDLCMLEHLPALIASGVAAFKIEGRMKGIHYVASTVKTYREAIDAYYRHPAGFRVTSEWRATLESVNQRGYCTGFYFGDPAQTLPNPSLVRPAYEHRLVGKVVSVAGSGRIVVDVRNRLARGDVVEILSPGSSIKQEAIPPMFAPAGDPVNVAHAGMQVKMDLTTACRPNDLIRRRDPCPPPQTTRRGMPANLP